MKGTSPQAQPLRLTTTETVERDLHRVEASIQDWEGRIDAQEMTLARLRVELNQQQRILHEWQKATAAIEAQAQQERNTCQQLGQQVREIQDQIAVETRRQRVLENALNDELINDVTIPGSRQSVDLTSITSSTLLVSELSAHSHSVSDVFPSPPDGLGSRRLTPIIEEAIQVPVANAFSNHP